MRKLFVLGLLFLLSVVVEAAVKDYIVILQKEPVAKVMKSGVHSKAVSVQKKIVLEEQAKVRTFIKNKLNGKVKDSVAIVLNALLVSIDEGDVQKLLSQSDVIKIEENKVRYHLNLDMADRISHMNILRQQLGLTSQDMGKGLKIAILDTGIDITNPMFDDTGYTYPEGFDPGSSNEPDLTNNKVIVAKNFGDYSDASDQFGHGTACASAAAGREVDMTWGNFSFTLKGSAPGAYLGNYKVFNHNNPQTGQPGATSYAIIAGINAAVADGMDVLNLSLGGTATQSADNDSQVAAVENAVQAGAMVCIAAGNEGYTVTQNPDGSYDWDTFELAESSVSSPGIAPSAVTVGAVENARTLMLAGTITSSDGTVPDSLKGFRYGTDTRVAKDLSHFGPYPVVNIENLGVDPEGCSDFGSVDLTGKIALIKRGTCMFCQKIYNAEQAGAIGVIVYNYLADGTTSPDGTQQGGILNMDMSGISCAPYQTTIPGFFIRLEEGQEIIQMLQAGYDVEASFGTAYPVQSDGYKSIFSSYGPTNIDYNLKPDVSTVGNQLTLATQSINRNTNTMYDETGFSVLEAGTSFSSPLTAGYSAVVKQLFSGLTPADWKSILCITADFTQNYFQTEKGYDYVTYHRGLASTVFTGSGRINMDRVANAKITIIPNAISFGSVDVSSSKAATTMSADMTIKNISGVDIKLEPSMIKLVDNSKVSASFASTAEISLASGESTTVTLNVTYQGPVATDLQGYLQFYDNYGNTYTVPYFGRFRDSSALSAASSASDDDGDGIQKSDELYVHSDPFIADTDNDGTDDGAELNATPSTDPANATDSPTLPSYTNKVYIPLTVTDYDRDEENFTTIYVVNPSYSNANVVVLFYNKKGELVQTPIERTLKGNGWRVFMADNNLSPSDQGWAVVMSNREVKAFAGVDIYNADGSEECAAAIPGTTSLSNMLYVPHVAEQTNQWNTMISVANPGTGNVSAQFVPQGGTAVDIPDFSGVDTSSFFDVVEGLYNGAYPFSSSDSSHWWGQIVSNSGIVGMEVFVQENDNLNQAAALLLNETTSNEIVIPHVETNWLWWTGIALNNPNSSVINVTFTPYDDNGNELATTSFTMDAGEKLAKLVQSFWADGEYPEGVKWIKVTADAPITGYELFGIDSSGDESSKDALAGVEAMSLDAGSSELIYAYTPKLTSKIWSGIVLLNAGDNAASVTIDGYNAVGERVAHTTKLLAKGKRVVSVVGGSGANDIFSSVTDDIRWIKVTSDQPIHGFELFGDQNFMYLSGVNALY